MSMMASCTGMRAGELPVIHWSDIGDKFIHIHRQQLKSTDENGKEIFYEVGYTKDERTHPHGGRFFPIR